MSADKFWSVAGAIAVGTVAGIISYEHQVRLVATHGQAGLIADIYPIGIDGSIVSASIMMAHDRRNGWRPRPWALVGFWGGVAISVAANWLAADGNLVSHWLSALPALLFLATIEGLTSKPLRRLRSWVREHTVQPTAEAPSAAVMTPPLAAESVVRDGHPGANMAVTAAHRMTPSGTGTPARRVTPRASSTAGKIAAARRRLPDATVAEIAARAGVSESTARRHLAATIGGPMTGAMASPSEPRPASAVNGAHVFDRPVSS